MAQSSWPWPALIAFLSLPWGCGGPSRQPSGIPVDTISLGEELTLAEDPIGIIGGAATEHRPGHALYLVRAGLLLPSGRVVLATEGSQSLLYYRADGAFLGDVGRRGGGPGEFERLRSVHSLGADRVAAWDPAPRRITVFDSAGATVGTSTIDAYDEAPGGFYPLDLHAIGGQTFVLVHEAIRGGRPPQEHWRDSRYLTVLDRSGTPQTTVGPVPGTEFYNGFPAPGGSLFSVAGGDSAFYVGYGRGAYLTEYALDGTPVRRLLLPVERREIDASERTDIAVVDSSRAYNTLTSGSDGSLWVRLEAPGTDARWLVIDPVRRVARPVTLLEDLRLLDADVAAGRILLQLRDDTDREIVQVHRIEQRASARSRTRPRTTAR